MPLYRAKVTGGAQFTGATAALGLFDPGNSSGETGSARIQVVVKSLSFHTDGAATLIELRRVDPTDSGNKPLVLGGSDLGPVTDIDWPGLGTLANEDDTGGTSWPLEFKTTANTANAWLTIDWEFEGQQG